MKRTISIFNFSIKNASNDSVDIHIDGDIVDASTQEIYKNWFGDETSVSFKSFRQAVESQPAKTYNVYINSGGGMVTDAMAMHDFLIELQSKGKTVNTIGRGIVASAATYILMAGRNAEMSKNSWFMVHNVSGGIYGNVDEVESYAATLRKFNNRSRDFYAEYTGMRKEDVTKIMDAETWMTADDAKEKGFIKNVTGEIDFINSISTDRWEAYNYSNTAVLNAYNSSVAAPPDNSVINFLKNFSTDMKVSFKSIADALAGVKPANAEANTIINAIAAALTPAFDAQAAELETSINTEIANNTAAVTKKVTEEVTASVTKSVTDALTASFEARFKALEKANGEIETEVENKLAGASIAKDDKAKEPKMKGTFSKAVGAL